MVQDWAHGHAARQSKGTPGGRPVIAVDTADEDAAPARDHGDVICIRAPRPLPSQRQRLLHLFRVVRSRRQNTQPTLQQERPKDSSCDRYLQRWSVSGREENCSAGGGGTRKPIFPTPPPPSLAAVTGGGVQGGGARPAVPGGGGGSTQHLWLKMIPTSR